MKIKSLNFIHKIGGHNLVELIVVAFIASIFAVALVTVYANSIQYYKESVTLSLMYSDAISLFHSIGKHFRNADQITLLQPTMPNDRVTIHIPSRQGNALTGGTIEIYYDTRSHTLRMDDGRADHMEFNISLMPRTYVSGRRRATTNAYNVKSVVFEQATELLPSGTVEDYNLVRMKIVLQDPNGGDTLALQFAGVNRNVSLD
jgi:hypothetical protein